MILETIGRSAPRLHGDPHLLLPETATTMPISILIYGKDERLVETRQWMLESCGYRARIADRTVEVERMAEEGAVDLLLLCHSLSAEESGDVVAAVLGRHPAAKVLTLMSRPTVRADRIYGATMDVSDGPARLLECIAGLVGTGMRTSPAARGHA